MGLPLNFTKLDLQDALRNFLLSILPGGRQVFQGQDNRVPEPLQDDFVIMTLMGMERLATDIEVYDQTAGASTMELVGSGQYRCQLDCHGDASADDATTIWMAWRSPYAVTFLGDTPVTPLYADGPVQAPFFNAEGQWEYRWTIPIYFQVKPVLTIPQDYATTLAIQTYEADQ